MRKEDQSPVPDKKSDIKTDTTKRQDPKFIRGDATPTKKG